MPELSLWDRLDLDVKAFGDAGQEVFDDTVAGVGRLAQGVAGAGRWMQNSALPEVWALATDPAERAEVWSSLANKAAAVYEHGGEVYQDVLTGEYHAARDGLLNYGNRLLDGWERDKAEAIARGAPEAAYIHAGTKLLLNVLPFGASRKSVGLVHTVEEIAASPALRAPDLPLAAGVEECAPALPAVKAATQISRHEILEHANALRSLIEREKALFESGGRLASRETDWLYSRISEQQVLLARELDHLMDDLDFTLPESKKVWLYTGSTETGRGQVRASDVVRQLAGGAIDHTPGARLLQDIDVHSLFDNDIADRYWNDASRRFVDGLRPEQEIGAVAGQSIRKDSILFQTEIPTLERKRRTVTDWYQIQDDGSLAPSTFDKVRGN